MVHSQVLSNREKTLAIIVGALLIMLAIVGYVRAAYDPVADANRLYNDNAKELERFKKEYERCKTKFATLGNLGAWAANITFYESTLQKMRGAIDAGAATENKDMKDAWDLNGDLNTPRQDINDSQQFCQREDEWVNIGKNFKNMPRELKDSAKQLESAKKDAARLKSITEAQKQRVAEIFANAEQKLAVANERIKAVEAIVITRSGEPRDYYDSERDFRDAQNDFNSAMQDWWGLNNELNCSDNITRNLKNKDKNLTREYERAVKKLNGAPVPEDLEAAYQGYVGAYAKAAEIIAAGGDCMEAQQLLNDANQFQNDFWQANQGVQETESKTQNLKHVEQDLKRQAKDLERMKKELSRIRRQYERAVKKYADREERKQIFAEYAVLVEQGQAYIARVEEILAKAKVDAPSDPESYWMEYMDELNDLRMEGDEWRNRVQQIGDIMRELKNIERDLKGRERDIRNYKGTTLESTLRDLLNQGKENISTIWTTLITDPEAARETLNSVYELGNDWGEAVQDWQEQKEEDESGEGGFFGIRSPIDFGPPPAPAPASGTSTSATTE